MLSSITLDKVSKLISHSTKHNDLDTNIDEEA